MELFWIVFFCFIISLVSFSGALFLFFQEELLRKMIIYLVAFSTGALLGNAFLHILPEAIEISSDIDQVFMVFLVGFIAFFFLEQFIHWHHCHKMPKEHKHPVTYLILFSDGVHNFIDGMAIGGAFLVDFRLGITTFLATLSHEIPQELGDFGILIHGGWSKIKALLFNFYSALTIILGGIAVYFLENVINLGLLLSFVAGNFVYIACSDLIPEIKKEGRLKDNYRHLLIFLLGLGIVYVLGNLE